MMIDLATLELLWPPIYLIVHYPSFLQIARITEESCISIASCETCLITGVFPANQPDVLV